MRACSIAFLGWLAASCASHAPPPASPTPPTTIHDAGVTRWRALAAGDKAIPADRTAAIDDMLRYLASPDPERRDAIAYELLAHWIRTQLTPEEVRSVRDQLLARLAGPLVPDGVYGRSFAALVLAAVAARDREAPMFAPGERRALLTAARDYAHRETDLRGYTGEHGWAHAAAHTADLLVQLGANPALTEDDRALVLDAITGFVVRPHGQILAYGEDGRLAQAVLAVAHQDLPRARLDAWLLAIRAPLTTRGGPAFDAGLYAAQRNARNLLFTLFVQASLGDGLTELRDAVEAVLKAT